MKIDAAVLSKTVLGVTLAGWLLNAPANCSAAAGSTATTPAATNAPALPTLPPIPPSVFVIPSSPKEGRNPFFPATVAPVENVKPRENSVDVSLFILNGITSPPKRTAMINGRTFESGEEGEVRLPNGTKELIRCEEIREDSAIIVVRGVRRELRFRSGF